jgi:hypothetical protein
MHAPTCPAVRSSSLASFPSSCNIKKNYEDNVVVNIVGNPAPSDAFWFDSATRLPCDLLDLGQFIIVPADANPRWYIRKNKLK